MTRVGVLTGGGDAPGLNAVIRAVVHAASSSGWEVIGIEDSFDGLLEPSRCRTLTPRDVAGILRIGGTILGTTNRGNPFASVETAGGTRDYSERCIATFHALQLDALIVIGGDGTLGIAHQFHTRGVPIVGVPKTIDNDIAGTTSSFGFDSAVSFATDAIDRLHTTAESHHRVMVIEVMGRYTGWIALHAGVAGGADVILIPEIHFDVHKIAARIRERDARGARFSMVVVAEGARALGSEVAMMKAASGAYVERFGGIAAPLVNELQRLTGKDTRHVVLGHLQRGGAPNSFDRLLATRFGARAVDLIMAGEFGRMVALDPPEIVSVPLDEVVGRVRKVPADCDVIRTARAMGISLGD